MTTTVDEFDQIAALVDNATRPEDIFGFDASGDAPTTDAARTLYRRYATLLHPDRNAGNPDADAAFAKLSTMWDVAMSRLLDGTYGKAVTITTKTHTYRLSTIGHEGLCVGYIGTANASTGDQAAWIKVARQPGDSDLLNRETTAVKAILAADTTKNPHFFPNVIGTFRHKTDGKQVRANALVRVDSDGFISLEQVIQRHQRGIDARDMAWMFRRLLGALGEAHAAGFVHGAVLPHHVLVHPVSHDLILVDWTSASKIGGPQRTPYMVSRYKDFYPDSTAAKEPPTVGGDIHMAARTMQALLGKGVTAPGQIAYWDRGCPPQIRSFLAGCITPSSFTAWEMLDLFTELIERLWGKRQYHEFPWP